MIVQPIVKDIVEEVTVPIVALPDVDSTDEGS